MSEMGSATRPEGPSAGRPSRGAWALAFAAVAIVLVLAGVAVHLVQSARRLPSEVIDTSRQALREVAAAFRTGTITTTFRSEASAIRGTKRLQFGEVQQLEVFERRDEAAILWGGLRLPDVVVEARAPVTYTYFVDLDKEWRFRIEGRQVEVQAPAIEWNRPAVDVSALRYEIRAGSVFRDEQLVEDRLRDELTALAGMRARQHVAAVRETGRREVERFVETWLVQRFSDGEAYHARVRFADEPAPAPPAPPVLPSPRG